MTIETLASAVRKSFDSPDQVREFQRGRIEVIQLEDTVISRITLEPGWTWSNDIKPTAGTETCQVTHLQYVISGRLKVDMDDGSSLELKAGDITWLPAGHTAEVLGNEPYTAIDMSPKMLDYFKKT